MSNSKDTEYRSLLKEQGSDLSDLTLFDSPLPSHSFHSSSHGRNSPASTYLSSLPEHVSPNHNSHDSEQDDTASPRGLGISGTASSPPIRRVPVGTRRSSMPLGAALNTESSPGINSPRTPGSARPLLTPQFHTDEAEDFENARYGSRERLTSNSAVQSVAPSMHMRSVSFNDTPQSFADASSATLTPGLSLDSPMPHDDHYTKCRSRKDIMLSSHSSFAVTILILSVYSTVMSGLWLIAALVQPRWGHTIHSRGTLTPSTASLLSALFAKTIELSFVTVFVAFIGQVLSRRSIAKESRGVTLAEMSMRTWVIQPGALLTHRHPVKYAGLTFLGIIALIATLVAMLYTTASDALVSPKLKFGGWDHVIMEGLVKQSYGNNIQISEQCQVPIRKTDDPVEGGATCLSLEHAGQAYHNYQSWLSVWASINANGTGESSRQIYRPQGIATLYENTTVTANWILESNVTEDSDKWGRIVNNVTMAMPHAGVFAAARDERNDIVQPGDLQGSGEYRIRAGVPSPSINVLCANVMGDELAPLLYVNFTNAQTTNTSGLPNQIMPALGWEARMAPEATATNYWNETVLDDLFEWGANFSRKRPVFPMLPVDYNTLMDSRALMGYGDSMYLLTKAAAPMTNYTICSLRSFLSPNCSTHYNVTGSTSGSLDAYCEDPHDHNNYISSQPAAKMPYQSDWHEVIVQWSYALSLNDGSLNANASNARLLSQFVVEAPAWGGPLALPPLKPSIAEAIAVLAGSTLLLSSFNSPFVHMWDYPSNVLDPGIYQAFNATIQSQQYTSGYVQRWQASFYVVLFLVFGTNVFCLIWFIVHRGLVTDFTEPQNLFALAVNSPPSDALKGSCGAGPEGRDLGVSWTIGKSDGHYYIGEKDSGGYATGNTGYKNGGRNIFRRSRMQRFHSEDSYEMLSGKRKSWL